MSSVSSTSSSSSTADVSNGRYWGLASGLNVDSIVTGLVSDIQSSIDKANQSKTKLQWKQSAYQDIVASMNTFSSTYLSLTGSSNILSSNVYAAFDVSSDNSSISVTANSDASAGSHTLDVVQSAVAGSIQGTNIAGNITGTNSVTLASLSNSNFYVTVDGVTKNIDISADDVTAAETAGTSVADFLSNKINSALGYDYSTLPKVSVSTSSGLVTISASSTFSTAKISLTSGSTSGGSSDTLSALGISSSASNRININTKTVGDLMGSAASGLTSFDVKINGVTVTLNTTDTLSAAFNKINSSSAGVTVAYSSTNGKISITSNTTGASTDPVISDSYTDSDGNTQSRGFFTSLFGGSGTRTYAKDAVFVLDGQTTSRSSNSFTVDGVTYSINKAVTPATDGSSSNDLTANISLTTDTASTVKSITNFVNAYNTLLDSIYSQLNTKPDSDYAPLTDTQKASMSDTEIDQWTTKAKAGLLYDDDTLTSIVDTLRSNLYKSVTTSDGQTVSLYDIGISTTNDYTKGGELQIDTDKLTKAIQNNPSLVQSLFTQTSSDFYHLGSSNQAARKNSEGIAYRIQDIINDATTTSGIYPNLGSLIVLAGTSGDSPKGSASEEDNTINMQLDDINDSITKYNTQLTDKKNRLYTEFEALETAMEKMNSQSSMLSSLGSSSS